MQPSVIGKVATHETNLKPKGAGHKDEGVASRSGREGSRRMEIYTILVTRIREINCKEISFYRKEKGEERVN